MCALTTSAVKKGIFILLLILVTNVTGPLTNIHPLEAVTKKMLTLIAYLIFSSKLLIFHRVSYGDLTLFYHPLYSVAEARTF